MSAQPSAGIIGVFSQVGRAPRFYWLMAAMVPASFSASTVGAVRVILAAHVGGTATVGTIALVSTVVGFVGGLLGGRVVDRVRANVVLGAALAGFTLSYLALAFMVERDAVSTPMVLCFAGIDGALYSLSYLSLIKVQSALVRPEARGAAESISSTRSSIGGLLGALLAENIVLVVDRMLFCAAITGITFVLVLLIPRGAMSRPEGKQVRQVGKGDEQGTTTRGSASLLVSTLRTNASFRKVVVANLTLYLVVPSTVLSLSVVSEGLESMQSVLVAASIAGVLAGRLILVARGTRGAVSRDLTLATVTYGALALVTGVALIDEWITFRPGLLSTLIFAGSACGAFTQSMLAAKFQEQVPDAIRGQASGAMYSAVAVQLSIGILLATTVVAAWTVHVFTVILGVLLLLAVLFLRGFRGIT